MSKHTAVAFCVLALCVVHLVAARECTANDYVSAYTQCRNNLRDAVWYKKPGVDCSGGVNPPNPVYNIPCDITCAEGEYLPFGSTSAANCTKCGPGTYSLGGGVKLAQWEPTLSWRDVSPSSAISFTTYCYDARRPEIIHPPNRCPGWIIRDGYVDSGEEPQDYDTSVLEMSVSLVQNGRLAFEYRVDAEVGYDSMYFEVDGQRKLGPVSHQLDYVRFAVNLTAGVHKIKWSYVKDFSLSDGADRAFIKSIEIKGTDYADVQCLKCPAGTYNDGFGAPSCKLCEQDTYSPSEGADRCQPCGVHEYAYPGSSQCSVRAPCTVNDYVVTTSPCSDSLTRNRTYSWLSPKICDDTVSGAVQKPADEIGILCAPCNPGTYRPEGSGTCQPCPLNTASPGNNQPCQLCSSGTIGRRDIVWNSFDELPVNVHYQTGCEGACGTSGWRRAADYTDSGRGHGDYVNNWFILPVTVEGSGTISFNFSFECTRTCQLSFVDTLIHSSGYREIIRSRTYYSVFYTSHTLVTYDTLPGSHEFAFYFQKYDPRMTAREDRVLIWSIAITSTPMGGAASCVTCQPGQWADASAALCRACDPGKHSTNAGSTFCSPCERDTFAELPGSANCTACGTGTFAEPGSAECVPADVCTYRVNENTVYDLRDLVRTDDMYGPITDAYGYRYYLNVCSKQHSNRTCMDIEGDPLPTFSCIINWNEIGIDLGHILSFEAMPNREGVTLIYTGGSTAMCFGSAQTSQTRLKLICDPDAGVGAPVADNPIEPTPCHYEFTWRSIYGCPVCTSQDYDFYYTECVNNKRQRIYYWKENPRRCHGGQLPEPDTDLDCVADDTHRCEAGTHKVDDCVPCNAGEFSLGGAVVVQSWQSLPSWFTTRCAGGSCSSWSTGVTYIQSGYGDSSILEASINFARPGQLIFTYELVVEEGQHLIFSVDNLEEIHFHDTVLNRAQYSVDVSPGTHVFRWKFVSPTSRDGWARLYYVAAVGTRYHDLKCESCPEGTYQDQSGQSECKPCAPNTYNNETGRDYCKPCPAGYWSPQGATQCVPEVNCRSPDDFVMVYGQCVNGQRNVTWVPKEPRVCRVTNTPAPSTVPCTCPPGMYLSGSECKECPSGYYYDTTSHTCKIAARGKQAVHRLYLVGSENGLQLATLPKQLTTGCTGQCLTAWRITGSGNLESGVQLGEANSFLTLNVTTHEGILSLEWMHYGAPHNKFQIFINNKLVSSTGPNSKRAPSSKQLTLPRGPNTVVFNFYHSSAADNAGGEQKVVITSMDVLGASEGGATLADCPPGSYTDMEGSTDCKLCSPGTYANSTAGAQECSECPKNTYAHYHGASSCLPCGNVGFTSTTGATFCQSECKFALTNYPVVYDLRKIADYDFEAVMRTWLNSRFIINPCRPVSDADCHGERACGFVNGTKHNFGHNIIFHPPELTNPEDLTSSVWSLELPEGDFCEGTNQRRSTILKMKCDLKQPDLGTPKLVDAESDGCKVVFEWVTPAACPACKPNDFNQVIGKCEGGKQQVTYQPAENCYSSGYDAPKSYEQDCSEIEFPVFVVFIALAAFVILIIVLVIIFIKNRRLTVEYQLLKESQASELDRDLDKNTVGLEDDNDL